MVKVVNPLFSRDARGKFGNKIIFTRGGQARRYFKPRNPNTAAQQAVREAFKEFSMPGLTQEQADLLYSAISHLHDDRYSLLAHLHDDRYSLLGHLHVGERQKYLAEFDFNGSPTTAAMMAPFGNWGAVGTGTTAWIANEDNHLGIHRTTSHATNIPSGRFCYLWGSSTALRLFGGEIFEAVVRFPTLSGIADLIGFFDSQAEGGGLLYGAWVSVLGGDLRGKAKNGAGSSQTGTSYTVSVNTWYRAKVLVNGDASRVDFYLYSESGSLLWTDYLTNNIPIGASELLGCGFSGMKTTIGAANVLDVDWATFYSVGVER